LVVVRYVPLATKMVRRGECSDVPLATIAPQQIGLFFDHIACDTAHTERPPVFTAGQIRLQIA
jgi:hypothetical protein